MKKAQLAIIFEQQTCPFRAERMHMLIHANFPHCATVYLETGHLTPLALATITV